MPDDLPMQTLQIFLDPVMERYVAHVRTPHASSLDFAYRLNFFGNKVLFEVGVSTDDVRALLLATLLRRLLTAFQASIILCERGLPLEAQVMLRTVLEITFKIVAMSKDNDVAQLFIGEGFINKRKKYEKLQKLNSPDYRMDIEKIRDEHQRLKAKIKTEGIRELTTYDFAKLAGLCSARSP